MSERRRRHERLFPNVRAEVDEEIEFHISLRAAELERSGMSSAAARRSAERDYGDMEAAKRECRVIDEEQLRRVRHRERLDAFVQDLRFGTRMLIKRPGFAVVAIVTLALGVGANTAIFRLVSATLLAAPPYPDADRIVTLWELPATPDDADGRTAVADQNVRDWQARTRSYEAIAYVSNPAFNARTTALGGDTPMRAMASGVSAEFFAVLGVEPALGRPFTAAEQTEGGPAVAILSHGAWQTHYGGGEVLGRTVDVFGEEREIVGVMPPGFGFPEPTDVWLPAEAWGQNPWRTAKNWIGIGRLRRGVRVAAAQAEMRQLHGALRAEHGDDSGAAGALVTSLHDEQTDSLQRPLLMLLGAAGLVLLIACANLATALLARGAGRTREMAVRSALGAGRGRLVRQLLTESAVLSAAGAVAGVLVALVLLRVFGALAPASLLQATSLGLDAGSLAIAGALGVACVLLFGALPAVRTAASALYQVLRAGDRGATGSAGQHIWKLLVAGEVALAIVLLAGSVLLVRSFVGVLSQPTGFEAERVLAVQLSLPGSKYRDDASIARYFSAAKETAEAVPGVERAGMINHVPFGGSDWNSEFEIEGEGQGSGYGHYRVAGPGYFDAMGIPVLRGRAFAPTDVAGAQPVVVINRTLAAREFGDADPVGRRIRDIPNEPMKYREEWLTIVGVVDDVRPASLLEAPVPEVYVNVLQHPERARSAVLTLRTSVRPASIVAAVREQLRVLEPDVPIDAVPLASLVRATVAERRFTMLVLAAFAIGALTLAAVGIYGVVAYSVARRLREAGIRIALGGTPAAVRRLVQMEALRVVAVGAVLGLLGTLLLGRVLRGLVHEVSAFDPLALVLSAGTLLAVAWLASWLPARRLGRVDPTVVMQAD